MIRLTILIWHFFWISIKNPGQPPKNGCPAGCVAIFCSRTRVVKSKGNPPKKPWGHDHSGLGFLVMCPDCKKYSDILLGIQSAWVTYYEYESIWRIFFRPKMEGQSSSNELFLTWVQFVVRFPELVPEVVSNTLTLLRAWNRLWKCVTWNESV